MLPIIYNITILDLKDKILLDVKCDKYQIFNEYRDVQDFKTYVKEVINKINEYTNQDLDFSIAKNIINEVYEDDGYDNYWLTSSINLDTCSINIMINSSYLDLEDIKEEINVKKIS